MSVEPQQNCQMKVVWLYVIIFPAFLFQYGSDDHAEFLCVVSREVASNATDENGPQHTDKAKVNKS